MASTDVAFSGSIPEIYDRHLAELLFAPYAEDIAGRVATLRPQSVLETAAGTGLATLQIIEAVPDAQVLATDLNQAMLDIAARRISAPRVEFRAADAQSLPFANATFDVVACQFGMMFLPDRPAGYAEARRVLKPAGTFIFNVWNRLSDSPIAQVVHDAMAALFPDDPPSFFTRVPWGYFDTEELKEDVRRSGFSQVVIETVEKRSRAASPSTAAIGLCQGTPLRAEIEARGDLNAATEAAADALEKRFGSGPLDQPMSAHVVVASL
ncbi:class I SAM-dependent methyltransferase [Sphingomonas cavernae]|uniref:Methyltransferase domain-containing protein n=1 Tax=Sphingomonas cavernae TaxID=2320861 RepID=A0A418WS79_9SPHN|nr:class I SAM-dependent methyltransferase [Sphingomonas cavernae]RJF94046.1 methyltransferase domain-containing protein [Sphingomonas cavernae]